MSKYSRIDAKCRKMFVYRALWLYHNMTPHQIAEKFGVQDATVVRALGVACGRHIRTKEIMFEINRSRQLAWCYT